MIERTVNTHNWRPVETIAGGSACLGVGLLVFVTVLFLDRQMPHFQSLLRVLGAPIVLTGLITVVASFGLLQGSCVARLILAFIQAVGIIAILVMSSFAMFWLSVPFSALQWPFLVAVLLVPSACMLLFSSRLTSELRERRERLATR